MADRRSDTPLRSRSVKAPSATRLAGAARRNRWLAPALAILLLLVVAIRFAQPIVEGDLFWQMVYGSQMIERGTLRPDHTLYTWTPATTQIVYCSWMGELALLGTWKALGLAGVFSLRYGAVLAVLGLMACYARRWRLLGRPESWLILLVSLLASVVGTYPKPEIFSLVLWNALVFFWFAAMRSVEDGRSALRWIYAVPCLMVVWVNTHGAFMLAMPFLVIVGVWGVWRFPRREARHLLIALGLCAAATLVNPYGIRYPLQLMQLALGAAGNRPDFAWNGAYQPTLSEGGQFHHLPECLAWMVLGIILAAWRSRRDWIGVCVLFVAYVPLYLVYLRSSFFLPAIFGFGMLYLMRHTAALRSIGVLTALLSIALSGRAIYQAASRPEDNSWLGFGIGYSQPVDEAEYLARHELGPRIYNTYNAGGYLIWRLHPRYKVMVDARSFPFLSWFDELQQFQRSSDHAVFQSFLDRHPADVALVDFQEGQTWQSFLNAPGWRPAFYGPSAAVFVRAESLKQPVEPADTLLHLRNGRSGVEPFKFARAVGDYRVAWALLDQMQSPRLHGQVPTETLNHMQAYRDGHAALRAFDYPRAWDRFTYSLEREPVAGHDVTIMLLLKAMIKGQGVTAEQAASLRAGLARLQAPD
jgi:hypothetical protein